MADHERSIRKFFQEYEARTNRALEDPPVVDTEAAREAFAEYFVGASPGMVRGGKNGLMLRAAIPRGFAHYRKIGTKSMTIGALGLTPLDELHYAVKVPWTANYVKKDGTPVRIDFTNVYLVQMRPDGPRIFAYVTGDEEKVLKEHGVA